MLVPCTQWWVSALWRWGSWQVWSCISILIPQTWAEHLWPRPPTLWGPWTGKKTHSSMCTFYLEGCFRTFPSVIDVCVTWHWAPTCSCWVQAGGCRQGEAGTTSYHPLDTNANTETRDENAEKWEKTVDKITDESRRLTSSFVTLVSMYVVQPARRGSRWSLLWDVWIKNIWQKKIKKRDLNQTWKHCRHIFFLSNYFHIHSLSVTKRQETGVITSQKTCWKCWLFNLLCTEN